MPVGFSHVIYEWLFTFFCFVFVAVVVIKCFMIGLNVWWVYLAPQNIPRAIIVLTLGNKVILLLSVTYSHTPATDRRQQCKPQSCMYSHTQATHRQQCNITHVQSHVLSCSSSLSMASRSAQKSGKRLSGQSYRLDEKPVRLTGC